MREDKLLEALRRIHPDATSGQLLILEKYGFYKGGISPERSDDCNEKTERRIQDGKSG